jgi:general secretion pathway protein N
MNAADRRRLTPTLGVIAGVLALFLIALWLGLGRGAHWNDNATAPRLPPLGSTLPPPTVPPLEHFAAVWQHPLFSPDRMPEVESNGSGASGDFELTGVIMLPGLDMAIVHDKTSGKDFRLVEGKPSQDGPALLELHQRSAVVMTGGSRQQLGLIPGPSPDAGAGADAGADASVIVQPQQGDQSAESDAAAAAARARARALRERIEEARRRHDQQNGGG